MLQSQKETADLNPDGITTSNGTFSREYQIMIGGVGGDVSLNYSTSTDPQTNSEWFAPERIKVIEYPDKLEIIYKQIRKIMYNNSGPEVRVFKIVYSCVDGKWNKSDRIYGKILPPQEESYIF
jgi:hypothetical protein